LCSLLFRRWSFPALTNNPPPPSQSPTCGHASSTKYIINIEESIKAPDKVIKRLDVNNAKWGEETNLKQATSFDEIKKKN
jgi:hypothetical protein